MCYFVILLYPLQFEDGIQFLVHPSGLWCLDATHGLNSSGWLLYTLVGISNNRSGIPVAAFFVPPTHDCGHVLDSLRWVRQQVKGRTGSDWVMKVVMTDDDRKELLALYYLDPGIQPRVCYFHVDRNIIKTVKRSCRPEAAPRTKVLLGTMTSLPPTPEGRATFISGVEELLEIFPRSITSVSVSDAEVIADLVGTPL